MTILADYRQDIDNILATATDPSTWTSAIKDDALRRALDDYDFINGYETSFTVLVTGYEQDLSSITDIKQILSVAYPWSDGADFWARNRPYRQTDRFKIYFEDCQPTAGDTIRIRYNKQHAIQNLDAGASTTVDDADRHLVALGASHWACLLRIRQLSENPATPREAIAHLNLYAADLRHRYDTLKRAATPSDRISWTTIGL